MTLKDMIESDVSSVFLNADDFAEVVTYRPLQGPSRCIKAVVIRQTATVLSDNENRVVGLFEVHVSNDCTAGIDSRKLDLGGDKIDIAERVGQKARPRSIVQILDQDEGMLVLQCQ